MFGLVDSKCCWSVYTQGLFSKIAGKPLPLLLLQLPAQHVYAGFFGKNTSQTTRGLEKLAGNGAKIPRLTGPCLWCGLASPRWLWLTGPCLCGELAWSCCFLTLFHPISCGGIWGKGGGSSSNKQVVRGFLAHHLFLIISLFPLTRCELALMWSCQAHWDSVRFTMGMPCICYVTSPCSGFPWPFLVLGLM